MHPFTANTVTKTKSPKWWYCLYIYIQCLYWVNVKPNHQYCLYIYIQCLYWVNVKPNHQYCLYIYIQCLYWVNVPHNYQNEWHITIATGGVVPQMIELRSSRLQGNVFCLLKPVSDIPTSTTVSVLNVYQSNWFIPLDWIRFITPSSGRIIMLLKAILNNRCVRPFQYTLTGPWRLTSNHWLVQIDRKDTSLQTVVP